MSCKIIVLLLQKGGTAVFCDNLKQLREQSGIKQAALAHDVGVSRSAINAWEMGVSMLSVANLLTLCEIFHVSADYLLGLDDDYCLHIGNLSPQKQELILRLVQCLGQEEPDDSAQNK